MCVCVDTQTTNVESILREETKRCEGENAILGDVIKMYTSHDTEMRASLEEENGNDLTHSSMDSSGDTYIESSENEDGEKHSLGRSTAMRSLRQSCNVHFLAGLDHASNYQVEIGHPLSKRCEGRSGVEVEVTVAWVEVEITMVVKI